VDGDLKMFTKEGKMQTRLRFLFEEVLQEEFQKRG